MYIVHALKTNIIPFSALPDSPIWSSGSGAIKEIRLHEAEMKVSLSPALQLSFEIMMITGCLIFATSVRSLKLFGWNAIADALLDFP